MTLSETGESRVRGYLFLLEQSLRASGTGALAADAVREVESHIRERVADSDGIPNERDALEQVLRRLGSPSTVARAYSLEVVLDEAAVGGRFVPVMRSLFLSAATGLQGFVIALLLFTGYAMAAGFILTAVLKPVFPDKVGLWVHEGVSLGVRWSAPAGVTPLGGYWIIPISLAIGLAVFVVVHRLSRAWVGRLRERMRSRRS